MASSVLYLAVGFAGGLGAIMRFALGRWVVHAGWLGFPYATFAVNVIGSFLIGYLAFALPVRWGLGDDIKAVVISGFLGGFTTFSAFSLETINLFEHGQLFKALIYVFATLLLCLIACAMGILLAKSSVN